MFCTKCGKEIPDGTVCDCQKQPVYQQPQQSYQQPNYQQPQQSYQQPNYQQPQQSYQQPNYQAQPNYQQPYQGNFYTMPPVVKIGFGEAVKSFFQNYANFNGRATRSEYWYALLFNMIVSTAISFVSGFILGFSAVSYSYGSSSFAGTEVISLLLSAISWIYSLAVFVPNLALSFRRLHDIGKSGVYILMGLIPIAGPFILLTYFATDSVNDNEYGPRKVAGNKQQF